MIIFIVWNCLRCVFEKIVECLSVSSCSTGSHYVPEPFEVDNRSKVRRKSTAFG